MTVLPPKGRLQRYRSTFSIRLTCPSETGQRFAPPPFRKGEGGRPFNGSCDETLGQNFRPRGLEIPTREIRSTWLDFSLHVYQHEQEIVFSDTVANWIAPNRIESNRITDEPPCLLANDWLATLEMSDGKERGEGGGKEQKNSDKAVELFGEGKTAIGRGINTGLSGKSWTGTAAYTPVQLYLTERIKFDEIPERSSWHHIFSPFSTHVSREIAKFS